MHIWRAALTSGALSCSSLALAADVAVEVLQDNLSHPWSVAFLPDNRTLLIANEGDGSLSVIDLAQRKVIATPQAGTGCEALSYFTLS